MSWFNFLYCMYCTLIKRKLPLAEKFSGPLRVRLRQVLLYTKPTHIGQYQHFESNHPPHVKKGMIQNRCKRLICYNKQNNLPKLDVIKTDLLSNWYPEKVTESVSTRNVQHRKQKCSDKPARMVPIPYIKRLSEKFKRSGNRFNIITVFNTKKNS